MPSKYGFETVKDKQSRQQTIEALLTSLAPQIGQLVVDVLKDFAEAKGWYRPEVIGGKDKDQARWVWKYRIFPEFRSSLVAADASPPFKPAFERTAVDMLPLAVLLSRDNSTPELYISKDGVSVSGEYVQQAAAVLRQELTRIPSASRVKVTTSEDR